MRLLTSAEVALLHSDDLEVSAGCELLNADLTVRVDISDDLVGGRVSRSLLNTIHGTCEVSLTRQLVWGVDLIRLYMILSDGVTTARFDLGVYCLTTPERQVGESPETYVVNGQDRLYLLKRQVGADYTVAAGTTYRAALLAAVSAGGLSGVLIEGAAADATLPAAKTWPLVPNNEADPDQTSTPVTWLRVINDLQQQWNGRGVYAGVDGVFRLEAYRAPATRAVEFTFSAEDVTGDGAERLQTILGEDRRITEDVWAVPNRWVAIASNPPAGVTPSEANGLIQVRQNLTDGPTSQAQRVPAVWNSVLSYEAASSTALAGLIDRRVAADRSVTSRFGVPTGPFPAAGHADVYRYVDAVAGIDRKVQLVAFEINLDSGDTRMTWEAVS